MCRKCQVPSLRKRWINQHRHGVFSLLALLMGIIQGLIIERGVDYLYLYRLFDFYWIFAFMATLFLGVRLASISRVGIGTSFEQVVSFIGSLSLIMLAGLIGILAIRVFY